MIKLSHVDKSFGNHHVVRDLNIEVHREEIFGFLGPNGAGKSTTIKMIAGLLKPDSGHIIVGGYDIVKEPLQAKSLTGYIPDKGFVYEKLTGREFLKFVASLYKMDHLQTAEKMDEISSLFSITGVLDELIENYSAGMRQRLVFASALIHNPHILLIDEPIIGLDPKGVRMLKKLLGELSAKGACIFMATHSLALAEELCTDIGIIHNGVLLTSGKKEEFSSRNGGFEEFFLEITEGTTNPTENK
ncbi:MAG: ABC transporter ATP-binding protein [Thermodesulfovibrionia bacterium]|nr:ABC transporter ATP-binding protein [Thermodesulfovibrionia bacterium]